jgi:AICAR transformylase/IMP cyclohydrolase PurH
VDQWLGWAGGFVGQLGLTGQKAVQALESTLGPWQGGFEQMATFLDAFTDTYQHTGVQAVARRLVDEGFALTASAGTARSLAQAGLAVTPVLKVHEGRPNIEDAIRSGQIQLVINTPIGRQAAHDDRYFVEKHIESIRSTPAAFVPIAQFIKENTKPEKDDA